MQHCSFARLIFCQKVLHVLEVCYCVMNMCNICIAIKLRIVRLLFHAKWSILIHILLMSQNAEKHFKNRRRNIEQNPKSVFICCPVTDWRPARSRVYPASHSKTARAFGRTSNYYACCVTWFNHSSITFVQLKK